MAFHRRKFFSAAAFVVVAALALTLTSCTSDEPAPFTGGGNAGPTGKPVAFQEPVKLSSKDGVLEVRLSAHQGTVQLDTVSQPVSNFLVYGYQVIQGTASDGSTEGDNIYPAPTLHVEPGERLIVHYDNDLQDLTIQDFYDPAFTPAGGEVPIYPPALASAPLNLHTHGLHVSPDGNADNVLLDIPAGMGNTYDYAVPTDMPNGLYWYHSHRHTLTAQQTYLGLAGLLEIGRAGRQSAAGDAERHPDPRHGDAVQLRLRPKRQWPPVERRELAAVRQHVDATDRFPARRRHATPRAWPRSISPTPPSGSQFITNWYAGPLSPANHRGQNQFIPANLQSFTSATNERARQTRPCRRTSATCSSPSTGSSSRS